MDDSIKHNVKNETTWLRALHIIVFAIILKIVDTLIFAITLFQFVSTLLTGSTNTTLQNFSRQLSVYVKQLVDFLVYNSDGKPFPFSDFPSLED